MTLAKPHFRNFFMGHVGTAPGTGSTRVKFEVRIGVTELLTFNAQIVTGVT